MRSRCLGALALLISLVALGHGPRAEAQFVASMSELYRYYHRETGARLYTISRTEVARDDPQWILEGIAGYVFGLPELTSVPLYRFHDAETSDRIYTRASALRGERAAAYRAEGIAGYVFTEQVTGTVPFYAYQNLQTGDHFYTTRDAALRAAPERWRPEGIVAYIYPATEDLPLTPAERERSQSAAKP
jgi:hypothetical protein